ncbi:Protein of unknown function [Gryllus bimaculatus]|nr:Protein of unknown function [Gryllus bimaculatus]
MVRCSVVWCGAVRCDVAYRAQGTRSCGCAWTAPPSGERPTARTNATNRVLNWYSKSLIRNLVPVANHLFSEMYEGLLQKFFDAVPYRRLFRDVQPLGSPGRA